MEKSLKLFLSFLLILLISSCIKDKEESLVVLEFGKKYQGSSQSLNALSKAIELDSTNAEAWRELSIPYLKRGMPHLWEKYMAKAVKYDAEGWQAWRGYNYLWFYRDYKSAIVDFDMADSFNPNFTAQAQGHSVDYWRGIAYLGLKDYNNSILYFDKYINTEITESGEDWVEVTAFLYRGIAYYESGNYNAALFNFDKLIHYTESRYADGNYYKALVLEKKRDFKGALDLTNLAIINYQDGYYNSRPYVETLRQIYLDDLIKLKKNLKGKI